MSWFILTPFFPLPNRMIPPTSKNFLVNNLAAGTQYDLCVLAIYDDGITSLTATRVVGCVQFTTESEYLRCHFMQSQFLGGTMIIIIGGIIVASVLIFIIILMIRYKVCNSGDASKGTSVIDVHSQTNGAQSQGCSVTPSVSKQGALSLEGGEGYQKSSAQPPDSQTHTSETSVLDCSTTTSLVSQSWATPGSSGSLKPKRKPAPKPVPTASAEPKVEALPNAETQNTNRNNSTALQQPLLPAPAPSSHFKDTPILRRARPSSKYMTLPVEGVRAKRRYSLNENLSKHHCYIGPQKLGDVFCKRSMSMNGMLAQMANSDVDSEKATLSSSEWILESTVWMYNSVLKAMCLHFSCCVCAVVCAWVCACIGTQSIYTSECAWTYASQRFAPYFSFPSSNHIFRHHFFCFLEAHELCGYLPWGSPLQGSPSSEGGSCLDRDPPPPLQTSKRLTFIRVSEHHGKRKTLVPSCVLLPGAPTGCELCLRMEINMRVFTKKPFYSRKWHFLHIIENFKTSI